MPPIIAGLQPEKAPPRAILTGIAAERQRRDIGLFSRRAWQIIEPKRCVWNWHMDAILEHLVYVTQFEIRFLMICVPPRTSKSLLASVLWPVWHWLQTPESQFICASYTTKLSANLAGLSRRLIESAWFQQFYGHEFFLLPDDNKRELYRNNKGGYRISTSVKGGISTGFGGDIQVIDDPLSADDAKSDTETNNAIVWHDGTFRSRVNDPNRSRKVVIAQRLRDNDLPGHLMDREGHRWVQLVLPMEHDKRRKCITYLNAGQGVEKDAIAIFQDPRTDDGELLNPKRFNSQTAYDEKEVVPARDWNAQYQQQPEGQGGLILKRKWWRQWVYPEWHPRAGQQRDLPEFMEIIQVYDTALEEDEEADFSAQTTWGIFMHQENEKDPNTGRVTDGRSRVCALMLDMMEDRLEFPDLRAEVIRRYYDFKPDYILVEKKASGHGLVQELKRKNLPVKAVKLTDGGDKVARARTSSLMLEKGCIFYVPNKWSMHVIDRAAKFPAGQHKDIVDTLSIAWQYMRRHSDLTLPDDEDDHEVAPFTWKRKYG